MMMTRHNIFLFAFVFAAVVVASQVAGCSSPASLQGNSVPARTQNPSGMVKHSSSVLHLLTWIEGADGTGNPGPKLPPSQFAPYVNYALLAAGGGDIQPYGSAGITTVLYSEPNHYLPGSKMLFDQLLSMNQVALSCSGAYVQWNKPGMPLTYVTDIRMPQVAQIWKESIDLTAQQYGAPNIVFEDSSDGPYFYSTPAPPCDPNTHQVVQPPVWTAATEVMEGAVGYPVIFNGLQNGNGYKSPNQVQLVNGPAIGGLSELCYGSDNYNQGQHKNNGIAWTTNETTELTFVLAHKNYVCHNNETTDGSVPSAIDARIYQLSSFLLTFDINTSVYSSKWGVGASNTKVQPEEQFVPENPAIPIPATIAGLLEADGNYHRRYSDCYLYGTDYGRCDIIVNNAKLKTHSVSEQFTIGHELTLQGSGFFDGGTASIVPVTLTTLGPMEAAIVFP
jgi:hypothetical protein